MLVVQAELILVLFLVSKTRQLEILYALPKTQLFLKPSTFLSQLFQLR